MLIDFSVSNFRSIDSAVALSLAAQPTRSAPNNRFVWTGIRNVPWLSRTQVIFGANGSGKSNLFTALANLRTFILGSTAADAAQYQTMYTPFNSGANVGAPTHMQIEVLVFGVRYRYSMSFDSTCIRHERLLVFEKGKAQRWFERTIDAAGIQSWTAFSSHFHGQRELWRQATREGALFLTTAARLNAHQLAPLMQWMAQSLAVIHMPEDQLPMIAHLLNTKAFRLRVLEGLNALDSRILDVRVVEQETPRSGAVGQKFHATLPMRIEFCYRLGNERSAWLPSDRESSGRQHLLCVIALLLDARDHAKTLVVDNLSSDLDPQAVRLLFAFIGTEDSCARSAQMIVTTHNITLLDPAVLRKDEIKLMTLNSAGASVMRPMTDQVLRQSQKKRVMAYTKMAVDKALVLESPARIERPHDLAPG